MSMLTEKSNPAREKAKIKGEKIRSVIDGLASGLFPDRPFKNIFRTRVKQLKERKFQPQQTQGQNPMPQIQERFSQRPRLMDFLQSQEPQQPQLTEEERIILQERELQLLEDAERRSKEEMREKESQEQVEGLKRAKERMSIENLR